MPLGDEVGKVLSGGRPPAPLGCHVVGARWVVVLGFGWCACTGSDDRNRIGDPTGTGARGGAQGTSGSSAGGASGSTAGGASGNGAVGGSADATLGAGGTSDGGDAAAGGSGGIAGGEGGPGGGSNCDGDRYKAEKSQLDIYVMLDDSGSMVPWWVVATEAFGDFLNDPASAGIGVGIQYFGRDCDPAFYAAPRVPIAPLPGNVAAIQNSFPTIPLESTPTYPAMVGAIQHARAWKDGHPDHKVVVLLATDGEPSDCNSTLQNVSQAATEGLLGSPSIPTYVLGMGPALTTLNDIARAGGTGNAFLVDPNSRQALAQALNAIRGAAAPCEYVLPNPANVDPTKVNIEFTPPGGRSTRLPNVGDASRCSASGGWYYDNPQAPRRAILCPVSCSSSNVSTGGQVDVILGCATVVL
jgi:hypothetical protein